MISRQNKRKVMDDFSNEDLVNAAAKSRTITEMANRLGINMSTLNSYINLKEFKNLKNQANPEKVVPIKSRIKKPFNYTNEQLREAARDSKNIKQMAARLDCSYATLRQIIDRDKFYELKASALTKNSATLAVHGIFAANNSETNDSQNNPVNKMAISFINNES